MSLPKNCTVHPRRNETTQDAPAATRREARIIYLSQQGESEGWNVHEWHDIVVSEPEPMVLVDERSERGCIQPGGNAPYLYIEIRPESSFVSDSL